MRNSPNLSLPELLVEAKRRGMALPPMVEDQLRHEAGRRSMSLGGDQAILIPEDMTFRQWCEVLGQQGLKVDGHPFTLANRRSLWEIYDHIPTRAEDAFGKTLVLQKGAQMGLTVFEILANLYMAIKFAPCKVLMYLPDRSMAAYKSSQRFMPILRSAPSIYPLIATDGRNEGNTLTRVMPSLQSNFLFLWTSGRDGGVTESFPGDVLSLDECQGMTLEQIDRVRERLSASRIRFMLMLSTPMYPEMDINAHYLRGTRHKFYSRCGCDEGVVLTDVFLQSAISSVGALPIKYNRGQYEGAPEDFVYVCPTCDRWIPDPQDGEWRPTQPEATAFSYHMSQLLSPTVTPREIMEAWGSARTIPQKESFFRRKLGTPYIDPSQAPISLDLLRRCAQEGMRLGVQWKKTARRTFMGVDQMGSFSCVTIAERLDNGKIAVIHVEAVYALDPWSRLDELMEAYGVQICVAEQLPNIDSARLFAKRHEGRVFLITSYGDMEDMVSWGDTAWSKTEVKTGEEFRDRHTVRADQYRVMAWAFARLAEQFIVFPDPAGLQQEILEAGIGKVGPILSEMVWLHYTKTGLVIDQDDEERKTKRRVIKLGMDPHFSFSLMALCIAWFRAHGTATFILPTEPTQSVVAGDMPGLPQQVVSAIEDATLPGTCGACCSFDPGRGWCNERQLLVRPIDPACSLFVADV